MPIPRTGLLMLLIASFVLALSAQDSTPPPGTWLGRNLSADKSWLSVTVKQMLMRARPPG